MRLRRETRPFYMVVPTLLATYHLRYGGCTGSPNKAVYACFGYESVCHLRETLGHVAYAHCVGDDKSRRTKSRPDFSRHPEWPFVDGPHTRQTQNDYSVVVETAHFRRKASVQDVKRVEADNVLSLLGTVVAIATINARADSTLPILSTISDHGQYSPVTALPPLTISTSLASGSPTATITFVTRTIISTASGSSNSTPLNSPTSSIAPSPHTTSLFTAISVGIGLGLGFLFICLASAVLYRRHRRRLTATLDQQWDHQTGNSSDENAAARDGGDLYEAPAGRLEMQQTTSEMEVARPELEGGRPELMNHRETESYELRGNRTSLL